MNSAYVWVCSVLPPASSSPGGGSLLRTATAVTKLFSFMSSYLTGWPPFSEGPLKAAASAPQKDCKRYGIRCIRECRHKGILRKWELWKALSVKLVARDWGPEGREFLKICKIVSWKDVVKESEWRDGMYAGYDDPIILFWTPSDEGATGPCY